MLHRIPDAYGPFRQTQILAQVDIGGPADAGGVVATQVEGNVVRLLVGYGCSQAFSVRHHVLPCCNPTERHHTEVCSPAAPGRLATFSLPTSEVTPMLMLSILPLYAPILLRPHRSLLSLIVIFLFLACHQKTTFFG